MGRNPCQPAEPLLQVPCMIAPSAWHGHKGFGGGTAPQAEGTSESEPGTRGCSLRPVGILFRHPLVGALPSQFPSKEFRGALKTVKCSKAQIYFSSAKAFEAYIQMLS